MNLRVTVTVVSLSLAKLDFTVRAVDSTGSSEQREDRVMTPFLTRIIFLIVNHV